MVCVCAPVVVSGQRGFTLIELVMVLVLLGILSVVVLPKVGTTTSSYQTAAFAEQVRSALQYGQKMAVSHRRMVCAAITSSSVTLTVASNFGDSACSAAVLTGAASGNSAIATSPGSSIVIAPAGSMYFQPSGQVTTDATGTTVGNFALTVGGTTAISVQGATGYVN